MKTITLSSGREVKIPEVITTTSIRGKDEWVKALRSGKYKQQEGCLRRGDGFCCLGVKRDLEGCEWIPFNNGPRYLDGTYMLNYRGDSGLDGSGYFQGVVSYMDQFNIEKQASNLSKLNDFGFTFQEIADIIEIFFTERV